MRKCFATLILLLLVALWVVLPANAADKPAGKVKTFVSILPAAYFVERVGGPNVEVSVLVGPGQDPHTFEPTPRLMAKMANARVLFKMGFPFEETIIKKIGSTFKNVEVVDLQQGIKLRTMTEEEAEAEEAEHEAEHEHGHGHGHGEAEEHEHHHDAGDLDQHTWLDPQLVKIQAGTIADTLIQIDPSHKDQYEKNLKDFQADLDAIHQELTKALAPVKGKSFFVFHPAYGYFGDAFGLKQVPVQIGGKEPTVRQLARLIQLAKEDGVRVIFVQPQFSKKSAEVLAKGIGAAVVPIDPLAADYLKNLDQMAAKLESALQTQKK
ncbi:MAG: metal ABC transporter solute-binding protein, Zn/Mn family [Desulfomonilaceae bacterium]